jgi:16S rRNA (guanine527-N7)-methyltransferase
MQLINKYFPSLTREQTAQFVLLESLYGFWNERINVISRKDIENLYLHHVLHSLSVARVVEFIRGTTIIDAGTGGGFPGIPLAIMFPEARFILVDSITKKIKVVDEVIRETKLTNCSTRNLRMEDLRDKGDFVVCRAVAEIPKLFGWVQKNIIPGGTNAFQNGLLALKGGDLNDELSTLKNKNQVFSISDYFTEPFFEAKKVVHVIR